MTALPPRAPNSARVAPHDIRKAGAQGAATKKLQERQDTLEQENRELQERLERREAQGR